VGMNKLQRRNFGKNTGDRKKTHALEKWVGISRTQLWKCVFGKGGGRYGKSNLIFLQRAGVVRELKESNGVVSGNA